MSEKNCSDDFENATVQGLLFAHELGFKIITEDNKSLNELLEEIKELEKEKQDLKDKAKILVDYYSRRYVNAIFNNRKHSKQFKSDLWIVKKVLCVLDLYDDGDVDD